MTSAERLTQLVTKVLPALTPVGGFPPAAPKPGQAAAQWRAEVARVRAQHDAVALEGTRLATAGFAQPAFGVGSVAFHPVGTPAGELTAKVYVPEGDGPFPAILLLHGGAWWMGGGAVGFELNDALCRQLCAEAGAVVANLDYRLAPEHPFPEQTEDALAGLGWLAADPDRLGIDPGRLGILGISSGGNVAAVTAQAARDRLRAQLLLVPALDLTGSSLSLRQEPAMETVHTALTGLYCQGRVDPADPRVSPLLAEDLTGLPPTAIVIGTEDPLRDDGRRYADRLREAEVPVELHEFVMAHSIATEDVRTACTAALVEAARKLLTG